MPLVASRPGISDLPGCRFPQLVGRPRRKKPDRRSPARIRENKNNKNLKNFKLSFSFRGYALSREREKQTSLPLGKKGVDLNMKNLRKIFAILLVLCLSLGAAISAFADDAAGTPPEAPPSGEMGGTPPGDPPSGGPGGPGGTPPGDPPTGGMGGPGGEGGFGGGTPPGGGTSSFEYTAAAEITEAGTAGTNETYTSDTADESALMITANGAVELVSPTVTKTGDSNGGDNCNFYGLNAAVLVKDGANVTIEGGTVTSDADGANGVFCYGGNGAMNGGEGDGTTVTINGTTITTTGDGSGGIMTTGGGVTYANDLTVTTGGRSSAPIRTDRGGGTVYVTGGTYTSNGLGSPVIYSTAEIHVSDATLVSNLSEGVCIEGMNSIELTGCDMTVNNTQTNGNATFLDSIMIYQSMSGDADSGTSSFTMTGGSLTGKSGHMFHVTNTHAVITLTDVALINEDGDNVLLSVCDDGWSGASNIAELYASSQELNGTILVGGNSSMTLSLTEGSTFTGTFSGEITNAKGTQISDEIGQVSVSLDETSTWTLTADTWISEFSGNAASVVGNGYTLYVNGEALEGIS